MNRLKYINMSECTKLNFSPILQYFCGDVLAYVALHYENMPVQMYRKILPPKMKTIQIKNSDIFHISAQNIDCGYSLEPPRRGGSSEYPHSMF